MVDHERMYEDVRRAPFVWLTREVADTIWPKMSDKAARIYISLCALQDGSHSARGCWPGLAYLAQQNACSQDAVRRALSELADLQVLKIESRFTASGAQQSNRYVLIDPETPLAPVLPPPRVGATPPLAPVQGDQYIYDQDIKTNTQHSALRLNVAPVAPTLLPTAEDSSMPSVPVKKASKTRSKPDSSTSTPKEQNGGVQDVLRAYAEACGYEINWGREGKSAKQLIAQGFSVEQVIACYQSYKTQPFWADKHLSLSKIAEHLPAFTKAQSNPPTKQHVVDRKNGIMANGWQNLRESDYEHEFRNKTEVLTEQSIGDILREALSILSEDIS